ncbi:MAG: hypothetical protein KGL44_10270 [Sphingomonadales bacterium]|nr:hypothetical protein [Sphingomonadales bacterium]
MVVKFTKPLLAIAFGAAALTGASPAAAHDEWRGRRGGGDDAVIAIGAGIIGLAIGAAIASDDRPRYDDRRVYYSDYPAYPRGYYYGYPAYPVVRHYGYYESPREEWREHHGWRGDRRGWRRGGW